MPTLGQALSTTWSNHWPLATAVAIFVSLVIKALLDSLALNGDRLVYALDDAYIHMAMSRNLVEHGVWGLTADGFTSSSSSPAWTLLLAAGQLILPANQTVAFVLGATAALAALVIAHMVLRRAHVPPVYAALGLLAVVVLTPLPTLVFTGLEHTLHVALALPFLFLAAGSFAAPQRTLRDDWLLLILAPLLSLVRYEGVLAVGAACGLFLLKGRWRHAVSIGGLGLLPPTLYGLISIGKGWFFFPNSILMKTNPIDLGGIEGWYNLLLLTPYLRLVDTPHVLVLFGAAVGLSVGPWRAQDRATSALLWLYAVSTFLHMMFAQTRWFYRYEAYLVALGIIILLIAIAPVLPTRPPRLGRRAPWPRIAIGLLALAFVLVPLGERAADALGRIPQATKNIHEQHYQMGLFLQTYYDGQGVAANDVGAINYLANIHCLDLWGLASNDVGHARREHRYDTQFIRERAASLHLRIAIVYEPWFEPLGGLPSEWHEVGTWSIRGNVVTGGDTITFFALDPTEAEPLSDHLREFSQRLPPDVIEAGEYLN